MPVKRIDIHRPRTVHCKVSDYEGLTEHPTSSEDNTKKEDAKERGRGGGGRQSEALGVQQPPEAGKGRKDSLLESQWE